MYKQSLWDLLISKTFKSSRKNIPCGFELFYTPEHREQKKTWTQHYGPLRKVSENLKSLKRFERILWWIGGWVGSGRDSVSPYFHCRGRGFIPDPVIQELRLLYGAWHCQKKKKMLHKKKNWQTDGKYMQNSIEHTSKQNPVFVKSKTQSYQRRFFLKVVKVFYQ